MTCNETTTWVDAYADGELDALRAHAIERHLRRCATCAAKHEHVVHLRSRLRTELPYFEASDALRERVRVALDAVEYAERRRPTRVPQRWTWLTGGALAGCVATILSWFVGSALIVSNASESITLEAVAMHVRATRDGDLIQVASSDQHTVKPWLSARLDYSPPVRDYSAEGFTLIGGRLDTLQRHTVATLVYRYRLHTIDVFVRPASRAPSSSEPRTIRGFNVAYASGSGMDWFAVSDVSPDVLGAFVQRLADPAGPS